jgi:hypothetical protein
MFTSSFSSRGHFANSLFFNPPASQKFHYHSILYLTSLSYCEFQAEDDEDATTVLSNKPKLTLNGCANVLATLDSRSYHRALIRDANRIAEHVLLPMSLPWTHKVPPVARNIPCDIDEMIDVIMMDDGSFAPFENGSFGFGQFDTGQQRIGESAVLLSNSSGMLRAAARRSNDPGVIELTTVAIPPPFGDKSILYPNPPLIADPLHNEELPCEEEILLRCFETMQARKRRKVVQTRKNIRNYKISVKVNGSSSRSSIFHDELGMAPDLNKTLSVGILEATLPLEVEVGRKLKKAKAREIAASIGSYNVREAPATAEEAGKSSRTNVGRTRLMWTQKIFSDHPQRLSYSSLITGERLEPGVQKRPREILVSVIIGGSLYNGRDEDDMEDGMPDRRDASDFVTPFQATLHSDKLLRNLLADNRRTAESGSRSIIPPKIECVPDSCGTIHTVCVLPGKLAFSSVSSVLNLHATSAGRNSCTVCWAATPGGVEVMECNNCGLLAHPPCCLDPGQIKKASTENFDHTWKCSTCCYQELENLDESRSNGSSDHVGTKKSKRKPKLPSRFDDSELLVDSIHSPRPEEIISAPEKQCAVCLLSGGPMSLTRWGASRGWVHEVCRIWNIGNILNASFGEQEDQEVSFCALCGKEGGSSREVYPKKVDMSRKIETPRCVVKCAAAGCHVSVHPMCALISSFSATSNDVSPPETDSTPDATADDAVKRDVALCAKYTLTFASIKGTTNAFGKDPGIARKAVLPALFCGIHNPNRDSSFYGLYPGGEYLASPSRALTVPGCREPDTPS